MDDLDALTAAPAHHTLLLENERVRVPDTTFLLARPPRSIRNRWPAVLYVLSGEHFVRRDRRDTC